jgi:hypothetical protein
MRILFTVNNPLAACVKQQLHASYTWTGRRVTRINLPHVSALQQRVLFSVDSFTLVKAKT